MPPNTALELTAAPPFRFGPARRAPAVRFADSTHPTDHRRLPPRRDRVPQGGEREQEESAGRFQAELRPLGSRGAASAEVTP